jgi:uncharacterized protein (TIGR02246 family)
MNRQLSSTSLSLFMIVAGLFALAIFFSVRFLRQETVIEDQQRQISNSPTEDAEKTKDSEIPKGKTPKPAETPPDGTIKELVRTWNNGNAEDIAGLFTSDGTLIIPTGSEIQSRAEIRKIISEKRAGALKATTLANTVDEVSRPDAETAVVHGTYKLDGIEILGFSTSATGSYKLRQIKREGRWLISRAEVTGRDNG